MNHVTRAQLISEGFTDRDLARQVRRGELVRMARGHYLEAAPESVVEQHRALINIHHPAIVALESAALMWDLPLLGIPERVQLIQPGDGTSQRRAHSMLHSGPLDPADLDMVTGVRVTSLARTVVDLARKRDRRTGYAVWEAARWARRLTGDLAQFDAQTGEVILRLRGLRGVGRARRIGADVSAWSQSPAETWSRVLMTDLGLPRPEQQCEVRDEWGLVGVADFAWPDRGVLGEYDGDSKYAELARPGESPFDVMRREKRRQERLEACGWVVARWGKEELRRPELLARRVRAAFAIADARPAPSQRHP